MADRDGADEGDEVEMLLVGSPAVTGDLFADEGGDVGSL